MKIFWYLFGHGLILLPCAVREDMHKEACEQDTLEKDEREQCEPTLEESRKSFWEKVAIERKQRNEATLERVRKLGADNPEVYEYSDPDDMSVIYEFERRAAEDKRREEDPYF
jgi:hypothetical protein